MPTTPNEREALGIDYVEYVLAREKADRARKRYLRGQWFKRHGKGYKNRRARRAGLAEARRERRREHRANRRSWATPKSRPLDDLRDLVRDLRERSRKVWVWSEPNTLAPLVEMPAAKLIAKHAGDV